MGEETSLPENRYRLRQLAAFERGGRILREIPGFEAIGSPTAEQMQVAAIRCLPTDPYARFVLMPERTGPQQPI